MEFGVFTIVKDEHEYLDEWIQYHLAIGVSQIFVFDDVFSKPHIDICKKYGPRVVNKNIITIFNPNIREKITTDKAEKKSKTGMQVMFMKSCLNWLQHVTKLEWVAYIDADEFLTFENNEYCFGNIFSQYRDYDIVALQWKNFSASGHIYKPEGSVIMNYTTPCTLFAGLMKSKAASKLVFNLKRWDSKRIKTNHHIPSEAVWCKTDGSSDGEKVVYDKIYIRHYITKSFEEYCHKIFVRGQFQNSKKLNYFFIFNRSMKKDNKDIQAILKKYNQNEI